MSPRGVPREPTRWVCDLCHATIGTFIDPVGAPKCNGAGKHALKAMKRVDAPADAAVSARAKG